MKDWEALVSEYVITKHEMMKMAGVDHEMIKNAGNDASTTAEKAVKGVGGLSPFASTVFQMIPKVAPILFTMGAVPGGLWWLLNKEIEANKMKSQKKLFKLQRALEEAEGVE